jgi:serine/threonine protein kinase
VSTELDDTADGGTQASVSQLTKGGQLGKYRLDRVLGEGGMGVVWAAHDPDLDRAVAIKVLRYAQASAQLRQRLLREARAMAKLKHPNVLTVYEVGTVGERDYIAMELVDGKSLDGWLSTKPPEEYVWDAILAAGRGLAAAHDAGVVHRDFKPHNVLRSRDGRILVTDFGLARGLLGESDSASVDVATPLDEPSKTPELDATVQPPVRAAGAISNRDSDSVLDAPLTQTGALIGTPAYMSPEQYRGAPPDPRTDQFAFCVTAWQALTGDRPFKGQTIEEMRAAVGGGVAGIAAKLPRDVRTVLARGLDPAAEKRYPTLEALLDELERAAAVPRRRRRLLYLAASLVLVAAAATYVLTRKTTPIASACEAPETAFAEAWSPAIKNELQRGPGIAPEPFARVAGAFDSFRDRWIASYQKTCSAPTAKTFPDRIACLDGIRDEASTLTFMLRSAPPQVYEIFDPHAMLPYIGRCEQARPDAGNVYPRDQPRRSQVLGVLARAIALRGTPPAQLDAAVAALEREAASVGWQPAIPGVLATAAMAYLRAGQVDKARAVYARALPAAREAHDRRFESIIRVGQLEASVGELAEPHANPPPKLTDPRAPGTLHPELATAFSIARSATQDDPMLLGSLAILSAQAQLRLAQWNRYRDAYGDAIASAQEARKQFELLGDVRRAARSAALEAAVYLERGDERALDDALFTARRAQDAMDQAGLGAELDLDRIRIDVAFARRDYNEVHRIVDKYVQPEPGIDATFTGHVVPPGRATVIAWRGSLVGDPKRAFTDPSDLAIDVVESDETGAFTIHGEPGWAVMAEVADTRAPPQLVGRGPVTLTLAPTTTVSGTARGKNLLGAHAFARFAAGAQTWQVEVPIDRDGTFDLRGIPLGTPTFGTTGDVGDGTRRVLARSANDLTWPFGQAIDVIVRGAGAPDAAPSVWVIAGKKVLADPHRGALEQLARSASDVATASAHPIGASNTDAGRELYQPGDRHAVITGNATGEVTVCASSRRGADAPVVCKSLTLTPTVSIDYPDGRFAAGVTPILLEP